MMAWPNVVPKWYQNPIKMTNSTGYDEVMLNAWHDGEQWIRPREPKSIVAEDAPDRFYPFFKWFEGQNKGAASLIGLRAEEVMRYRAVTQYPAEHEAPANYANDNKCSQGYPWFTCLPTYQ